MFRAKDFQCVSCGIVKMDEKVLYCKVCLANKYKLNRCSGITRKRERCTLLTENEKCIHHGYYK